MMHWFRKAKTTTVKLAGTLIVLMSGPALAASNVAFTLELGGNNNSANWEAGLLSSSYYASNPSANGGKDDGQVFSQGNDITWGVSASASGIQAAGNGAGSAIYGIANFVFDIELHHGSATGALATTATFLSTINDGDDGPTAANDILAAASFALVYNLSASGPGRVVDPQTGFPPEPGLKGGPHCGGVDTSADRLKSATYPTAAPGKLIGMGGGYNLWAVSGSNKTNPGIGMDTLPNGGFGMGIKVLCEGQIDTAGLPTGTYVLSLVPGAGINVLRGDINLNLAQNAFATAADTTTPDTITFTISQILPGPASLPVPADAATNVALNTAVSWTVGDGATSHDVRFGTTNPPPLIGNQAGTSYDPPGDLTANTTYYWRIDEVNGNGTTTGDVWSFTTIPPPLTAIAWRSMRTHGAAGPLAIVLNPAAVGTSTSGPTSETRGTNASGLGVMRIEVDLSKPAYILFDPAVTDNLGNPYSPTTPAYLINGDQTLVMEFTSPLPEPLPQDRCYTIDLAGVVYNNDLLEEEISGDTDCKVRNLWCDVNMQGQTNLGDQLQTKSKNGFPVDSVNARWDVNLTGGTINLGDQLQVKNRNGHSACP